MWNQRIRLEKSSGKRECAQDAYIGITWQVPKVDMRFQDSGEEVKLSTKIGNEMSLKL